MRLAGTPRRTRQAAHGQREAAPRQGAPRPRPRPEQAARRLAQTRAAGDDDDAMPISATVTIYCYLMVTDSSSHS